jgi:uncharacterized membrane protein (UPF0127 family)
MGEYRTLKNKATGEVILARAKWCASWWCHFKGLQFVRHLDEQEGLLFVRTNESITATTIHMFFMFMNIGVVWLDKSGTVVDKKLARPWRPAYAPKSKAQYYLEAPVSILERVDIGDVLTFEEVT